MISICASLLLVALLDVFQSLTSSLAHTTKVTPLTKAGLNPTQSYQGNNRQLAQHMAKAEGDKGPLFDLRH